MKNYKEGDEVQVTVKKFSQLGAIVTFGDSTGLIYQNDIYSDLSIGDTVKAYIKTIREDGKIDLTLRNAGYRNYINPVTDSILKKLEKSNGFLPFNDNSSPGEIKFNFKISKKQFKQALGRLYKEGKIKFVRNGIELVKE